MSREKQIDEMEKIIADAFMADYNIGCDPCPGTVAEALYLSGYRKQSEGEWLEIDDGVLIGDGKHLECSECGVWKKDKQRSNFCPNCGAKMKGGVTAESAIKAVQEAAHELKDTPPDDLLGIGSTMQF